MSYVYVLTFVGDSCGGERYFRDSAMEIVNCIQDFMFLNFIAMNMMKLIFS